MDIHPTSYAEIAYLSTVRLLVEKRSGPEAASAFVVNDAVEKHFIVTARHVIEEALSVTIHFYSGEQGPDLGNPMPYEIREPGEFWHPHSDRGIDVVDAPLEAVEQFFAAEKHAVFVASIPFQCFAGKWQHYPPSPFSSARRPAALDEVLLVGFPNDYRDTPTSLPLLRRGQIATPLWLDHENRPVFVIDTAASHGTSGGPVYYVEEMNRSGNNHTLEYWKGHPAWTLQRGPAAEAVNRTCGHDSTAAKPGAAYKTHAIVETLTEIGFTTAHDDG
jgi:hypothetical protein